MTTNTINLVSNDDIIIKSTNSLTPIDETENADTPLNNDASSQIQTGVTLLVAIEDEEYDIFTQPLSTSDFNIVPNDEEKKHDPETANNDFSAKFIKYKTRLASKIRRYTDSKSKSNSNSKNIIKKKSKSPTGSKDEIKMMQSEIFQKARSALPSMAQTCIFAWRNLNVYVGNNTKGKQILSNFNGTVRSGELLAVMGGSGSGKSTLLNALSGRTNLSQQYISGQLAINGKKFNVNQQKLMQLLCTYVPQSDILCATQTVKEALTFYAELKLSHYNKQKQEKRINYLIEVLHLNKCSNNYIGDDGEKRGISGGEKRRVSIASEILNDADIIFLDEPTSGLDAYTAARTIKTLKEFSLHSNKIIIATIHQPSIEVFYLFDKLILLSNGKCCFNSTLEDINIHFKNVLRPRTNPADVIVFEAQRHSDKYVNQWEKSKFNNNKQQSEYKIQNDYKWKNYSILTVQTIKNHLNIRNNINSAPLYLEYKLLLKREIQTLYRDKRVAIIRLLQVIFFAFVCGGIYFNIIPSFDKKMRAFLLLTIITLLFGIVSLLTTFPKQKLLFIREKNSSTYHTSSWSLSFMFIEIPREIMHMLIFTVIVYYLIRLDGNFLQYCITFFLTSFSGSTFGILFGTISKSAVEAAQTVPAALIPLLVFSDGMVAVNNLPQYIQWMTNIDPMYWIIRCLYIIEFEGVTYDIHLKSDEREICDAYDRMEQDSYNKCVIQVNKMFAKYNFTDDIPGNITDIDTDIINGNGNGTVTNPLIPSPTYSTSPTEQYTTTYGYDAYGSNIPSMMPTLLPTLYNYTSDAEASCRNITTPKAEDSEPIDEFCYGEISSDRLFNRKNINTNDLCYYWMYILIICFVIRILSVWLLLVINNDGFSWLKKKIKQFMCCMCENNEEKSDTHQGMETTLELQEKNNLKQSEYID